MYLAGDGLNLISNAPIPIIDNSFKFAGYSVAMAKAWVLAVTGENDRVVALVAL